MKNALCRVIAAALTAALYPASGLAQGEPRTQAAGPVSGNRGEAVDTSRQKLNVTVDVGEAYDQNAIARSSEAVFSLFQGNGFYTTLTPGVDYTLNGERVHLGLNAGSSARYYSEYNQTIMTNESAGFGISVRFTPETTFTFSEGMTYAASLLSGVFGSTTTPLVADLTAPVATNYALNTTRSYASATAASLTRRLSRRAELQFTSNLQYTLTTRDAGYPDLRSRDAGGVLTYSLTQGVGLKLGYTFRQAQYTGSPASTEHDLNIGIAYAKPLSKTRKMTMTFMAGPTMATAPLLAGLSDVRRQYRVTADASLRREIGRTWSLQGNYHRGLGYIEGLQGPVFTGAYTGSAEGFLSRRTDLSMSVAYSTGESALTGSASEFTTYTGDIRLRYAATRTWSFYAEYIYVYYLFNREIGLPTFLPPGLSRNGFRTGMMLRVPVRRR